MFVEERELTFGDNCRAKTRGYSLDPVFGQKTPCVMGPGMDCGLCGCAVPILMRNKGSMLQLMRRLYSSGKS